MSNYFGSGEETVLGKIWNWSSFISTKDFPVSDSMLDWVIGQDKVLKECNISLREWVEKIKWLETTGRLDQFKYENVVKAVSSSPKGKVPAGPFLLLLGDPGTGKSLIGQALADRLTTLYQEHSIKLDNIYCLKNLRVPSNPKIVVMPSRGSEKKAEKVNKKGTVKKGFAAKLVKGFILFLGGIGVTLVGLGLYFTLNRALIWLRNETINPHEYGIYGYGDNALVQKFFPFGIWLQNAFLSNTQLFVVGGMLTLSTLMGWYFYKVISGSMGGGYNIAGTTTGNMKLLVDNSLEKAPFIDGTGARSSSLFGDIGWDPFQTGGLGTPEHQRVSAGLVHKAHKGILYVDEIKNLQGEGVIDLLTALEDGQFAITLRGREGWHGTAAMNVKTDPAPCMFFFVGAGNLDSVPELHPALKDRFYGYGKIVLMDNDMPNTLENRRKYVQFIAQEARRFNLLPLTKEACVEVVEEARRRAERKGRLTCKFRPLIGIVKTASTLAIMEGKDLVEAEKIKEAITEHCRTIEAQVLGRQIEEKSEFMEVKREGSELGRVNGLVVVQDPLSKEKVGNIVVVRASMAKVEKKLKKTGSFTITGLAGKILKESSQKVRQVVLKKYGVDVAQDYVTHIDFSQSYGVDGPSAGVTMMIALASLLEGRPARQDVAVTGEINVSEQDQVPITAVGGLYEKLKAAEKWGMKKVVIPKKNLEYSINPKDYGLEIVGSSDLDEYLKECLDQDGFEGE